MEVYGIDLGTTNSCIAEISEIDNLPVVIKNPESLQTTPSVVYFDDFDSPIVGGEARSMMNVYPLRTVAFIKREMSNTYYKRTIGERDITPVKISAMILKKLVSDANLSRSYRNKEPINNVVITVPAYFGNDARALTRQAGEAAGLNVLALLNEPTAAALNYGEKELENKTFMVYDLGGGTFDVSIMRRCNGNLETLSTDGNDHLGGLDWDIALVNHVLKEHCFVSETYDDIKDTSDGIRILSAAETCKKFLSENTTSPMKFRYKNRVFTIPIERCTFERITSHLLLKTLNVVRNAINMSTKKIEKIDEIILVGGSSYMPMVHSTLSVEFPNSVIRIEQFEPDLAVAKGAALYAHSIVNKIDKIDNKIWTTKDLASRSYGMECIDSETEEDIIHNLILRSDPIEYEGSHYFYTHSEGQSSIIANIDENTSNERKIDLSEGKLIASTNISWGYEVPKGTPIVLRVKRGRDGIVHIEAECCHKTIHFEITPTNCLSDEEMENLKNELSTLQL